MFIFTTYCYKYSFMKRKLPQLLSCITLGLLVFLGVTFNSAVFAQGTSTFSRPNQSKYYVHDGTNWNHLLNSTYTYNAVGDLTFQLTTHQSTNQNFSKREVFYDQQGKEKSNILSEWRNNYWLVTFGRRDSMIYDLNNRIVQQISSSFDYGNWVSEKFDNFYDLNGNLTQQLISYLNNGIWELRHRKTFTYVNGLKTEELFEVLNGTTWQNRDKYIYAGWHTQIEQPTSYTMQYFNTTTNQWSSPTRNTITLTNNGGYIILRESLQGNVWITNWRLTENRDFKGNYSGWLYEQYRNGAWIQTDGMQINLTYNNNFDITEKITRSQNYIGGVATGPFLDRNKEVYSNFQFFGPNLAISESKNSELHVTVAPNPTTGKIQIELSHIKSEELITKLLDITGKTFLSRTFKATEPKQLNLEGLPKGIYLLQLNTSKGTTVQKVVKQ